MQSGGKRHGAGRPPGSKSKRTREIADRAAKTGITPLEYMLKVMRDSSVDVVRRDQMAITAAPYMHPRLTSTEISGDPNAPIRHEHGVRFYLPDNGRDAKRA